MDLLSFYKPFFIDGLLIMEETLNRQEDWKNKLRDEWQATKSMPRKLKKRRRKEIKVDWALASYSPFDMNLEDLDLMKKVFN